MPHDPNIPIDEPRVSYTSWQHVVARGSFPVKTFATRQKSGTSARPASTRSPLLRPARNLSESTAERQASQAAARVMHRNADVPTSAAQSLRNLSSPSHIAASQPSLFRTPGHPLDPSTRSLMESRFEFDFSRIRIHNDPAAHQAADRLSARAFAHGRDIAFAQGQYKPSSAEGQHLLAHELAHTIQQSNSPEPVIRCEPNLHAATTFGERDSGKIDKVIAASPIKNFVDPKDIKTLAGNVDQELPDVFADQFEKYGKSQENVDEIPGFVNRAEKKPIKLRAPGSSSKTKQPVVAATYEVAVHETVHLNSKTDFQSYFGHPANEGVTEHFTEQVLGESGKAYRDQLSMARGLMTAFDPGGEQQVGLAYFKGAKSLWDKTTAAFGTANANEAIRKWQAKSSSDKPADWPVANQLLTAALAHPAPPQAPPKAVAPPPPPGSGSDTTIAPPSSTPATTTPSTPESKTKEPAKP